MKVIKQMKKNTTSAPAALHLELIAGKKMSEYWSDFQQFAKSHKETLAAAKAARDAAIRAANAEFAKVKAAENDAIHAAYLEFQRVQSEFRDGRAERREAKIAEAAEKVAEQTVAEPKVEQPLADVDTTGLTAEEIELLKAAAA